ncbi:MAG: UDP-N-acetylmuramoyl-tripeptide--D-alanyl-D-alanine ligase [Candidatus Obscuribacter sp.]|nr:UDP-N-acetylmuramoyl-tripeptide--D-alanyl-D-alanine ligase [Candidatus Obscuribacter sp.]
MLTFSLDELTSLAASPLVGTLPDDGGLSGAFLGSVCTDSRQIKSGHVYLALKGERFDGHRFVKNALDGGAALAVVEASQVESLLKVCQGPLLPVQDTLKYYQGLARLARRRHKPFVIGITGSSGKTTTKEMCFAVFSAAAGKVVHKSAANENNEIGVPKTILSMPENTDFLIVEMGMRGLGQIDELASTAEPNLGIITGAGSTHIELLGSRENIAKAKCELFAHIDPSSGFAICGDFSPLLKEATAGVFTGRVCDFDGEDLQVRKITATGTSFSLGSEEFFVHAHGDFLLRDAWCAVKAGLCAGLTPETIRQGLSNWRAVEGRGNVITTGAGLTLIDESYNANPDSVRCAVESVLACEAYEGKRKIIVLGKMAELGDFTEALHRELGSWLKTKAIDCLVTVGTEAGMIAAEAGGAAFEVMPCADQEEAHRRLRETISDGDCIMVKGSHSTNLEALVRRLEQVVGD